MRATAVVATFLSALWLPWPLTALLAAASALWVPLLPLAAGIFADILYYAPHAAWMPYGTVSGALLTALSYLVRRRLSAGIINE